MSTNKKIKSLSKPFSLLHTFTRLLPSNPQMSDVTKRQESAGFKSNTTSADFIESTFSQNILGFQRKSAYYQPSMT